MKQIECSQNGRRQVVWTQEHPKLKAGNTIRFQSDSKFWSIDKVHDLSIGKEEINHGWKVGGL